ncbi:MAG: M24 family metallopeptidase, partial [Planctomycetia bacterium]
LWDSLGETPDWIVVVAPRHLTYLCGYYPSPFVFRAVHSQAVLILGRDGSSTLVVDNMCKMFAEQAHVDRVETATWYQGKTSAGPRSEVLMAAVHAYMAAHCPGVHFGYEPSRLPTGLFRQLREPRGRLTLTDVEPTLHRLQRAKDADEVAAIRASLAAISTGMEAARRELKPGMTELQAFELIQLAALEAHGEQAEIYGDFVSGPRCETKGGPPSKRVIEPGDLVLLDFSVVVQGYRGDVANTFACGGPPTSAQRDLAAASLEALAAAEKLLKPGASCRAIDAAGRGYFAARGMADAFKSHLGHGLGLGHPDAPYIVPESTDELVVGDVVTLEPGQYLEGVGGVRYEHNYLITPTGYETLSHHLLTIDAA